MPCFERFERQDAAYKESVLPDAIRRRVSIEAGVSDPWFRYVGLDGRTVSIDRFGMSAPGAKVMEALGMTQRRLSKRRDHSRNATLKRLSKKNSRAPIAFSGTSCSDGVPTVVAVGIGEDTAVPRLAQARNHAVLEFDLQRCRVIARLSWKILVHFLAASDFSYAFLSVLLEGVPFILIGILALGNH